MLSKIVLQRSELDVILLTDEDYFARDEDLCRKPEFNDEYPFESYIDEKRDTEWRLREALEKNWTPRVDFEVADDENIAFTMCGSLYAPRVVCRDYLEILYGVLQSTRMRDKWVYSTSVEITTSETRFVQYSSFSSFRLQGNRLTVNTDGMGFDFVACFSRSREGAETGGQLQ